MARGGVMVVGPRPQTAEWSKRRRRLLTRVGPLAVVAVVAFIFGVIAGAAPGRAEKRLVSNYVNAWAHNDYARMYSLLDSRSRRQTSSEQFQSAYRGAATTATLSGVVPGRIGDRQGNVIPVSMRVQTRVFGTIRGVLRVPLTGSGSGAAVQFAPELLFPGLRAGEQLSRQMSLAPRAALLAADGAPLARGPSRTSAIPDVASQIVGTLGPIPQPQAQAYAARGYPPDAKVGQTGLERAFQDRLAGTPGGTLSAGNRALASSSPAHGQDVTTTIRPSIERAAVKAMGARYAGIAVMDPHTGGLLALAGVAFSALQPPGSTMKIITATGALDAGIVKLTDTFPVRSSVYVGGFNLQNAGGETCGGTLLNAFAVSCNSVFAPLGAKLGAERFVNIAERFGFNQPPPIPGAAESTIPSAKRIGGTLDVATSAIGQGQVQASALEMTEAGATIAMGGQRPIPTLLAGQRPQFVRVTSRRVASLVQRMMLAVVQYGTGTPAQISGVQVAGKTGTAELRSTQGPGGSSSPSNTDSWFVGYAPAASPRFVVGALFPEQGAGAQTAAPAVHDVLAAALHAG